MDHWLQEALVLSKKRLRPSSREVYESMWKSFYTQAQAHLNSGGQLDEDGLRHTLAELGSFATRKRQFMLFKWVLRVLSESGRNLLNPCPAFEREFLADTRPQHDVADLAIKVDKMATTATEQISGWKGARLAAIVRVLGDTGMKTEELISLKTSSVLLRLDGSATLYVGKKASTRLLPLSAKTFQAVQAWQSVRPVCPGEYLFVSKEDGRPLEPSTLWRQLKRLEGTVGGVEANLSGPTAIRAAFVAKLRKEGNSGSQIQAALGHRQWQSTEELLERVHSRGPDEAFV